jgi:hypothetical protein
MQEKEVALVRKQNTPFTVNYPVDGRIKKYVWQGTKGKLINKKTVPFEVYEWLAMYTTTFNDGSLIIDTTNDQEVVEVKENIPDVEVVEKSVLTKEEVEAIFTNGNHLVMKKELNKLLDGLSEELASNLKRYVITVAGEVGIDSSSKRKVLSEWAGLDYENSDLLFDKELKEEYAKESE